MIMLPTDTVLSEQSGWRVGWRHLKGRLLQHLSRPTMTMFLRPGDVISVDPIVGGVHEQHVADFFVACARSGYSDFFIDIGANIGLTSCPAVEHFKRVYAFEPNPLAFSILSVNAECTGYLDKFELNNFGIGERDAIMTLMIPKNNWGGAFVDSDENGYSRETLSAKDNFTFIDAHNYLRRDVNIREGRAVFASCFAEIETRGGKAGVIKIDVEGFELSVLSELAKAIPSALAAYIIFENWEPSITIGQFAGMFGSRASAYSFAAPAVTPRRAPRFVKALRFVAGLPFGRSDFRYGLRVAGNQDEAIMGDLVLHIASDR